MKTSGSSKAISTALATIVIVIIVLATGAAIYISAQNVKTVTSTQTSTATTTTVSTSTVNTTVVSTTTATTTATTTTTATVMTGLALDCSSPTEGVANLSTLVTSVNAPAYLCIRLYYYSESSAIHYNTLEQVSIQAWGSDASASFSIFAQPSSLTIGGPNNLNEGAVVVYTIIGRPGSNGTYNLDLGLLLPLLESCTLEFRLVSGTGRPNFTSEGDCIGVLNQSSFPYPPGVPVVDVLRGVNATSSSASTNSA